MSQNAPVPDTPAPYTPEMESSQTLQAQHTRSNDSPTDVNANAALARVQAQCTARIGEEFQAAAARRTALFDHAATKLVNA